MSTLKQNLLKLIEMSESGKAMEAMQMFYDENIVMIQPDGEKFEGLANVLKMEGDFFGNITEVRDSRVTETIAHEDSQTTWDISYFDADHKVYGPMKMKQVSVMKWKDGKVVHVQFFQDA